MEIIEVFYLCNFPKLLYFIFILIKTNIILLDKIIDLIKEKKRIEPRLDYVKSKQNKKKIYM